MTQQNKICIIYRITLIIIHTFAYSGCIAWEKLCLLALKILEHPNKVVLYFEFFVSPNKLNERLIRIIWYSNIPKVVQTIFYRSNFLLDLLQWIINVGIIRIAATKCSV